MKPRLADMTAAEKKKERDLFTIRLGKRIRSVRLAANISQEQLSERAGYYRTYVGHIENATKSPTVHTVWRLAKALDMDLSDLLKGV